MQKAPECGSSCQLANPAFSKNSNRITTAEDGADTLCGCKLSQLHSDRLKKTPLS